MKTENIVKFMETAYTDEKLAALLAHAEDGKLSVVSCCCFVGITTATHSLRGYMRELGQGCALPEDSRHYIQARLNGGWAAENEFWELGHTDAERRAALIPLIQAEIARREALRTVEEPIQESMIA